MLPCIQQLLLKTNAEFCAAGTLNAVAWCRRLLGVAVVECLQALLNVYAAVVAVYRCCRIWLPTL
jgi:hypothetical protein